MSTIRTISGVAFVLFRLESLSAVEPPGEVPDAVANFVEHSNQHPDGTLAFTIDVTAWSEDSRKPGCA